MKNSIFSCLTAWLKAENFVGKRRFLVEKKGINFVGKIVSKVARDAEFNARLRLNVYRLVHDLVLNDDGIVEKSPFHVREALIMRKGFLGDLISELTRSDIRNVRER